MPLSWVPTRFRLLLSTGVRNGLYKAKEFHGRGAKIVNMGELFANPRLGPVPMKRVEVNGSEAERFGLQANDLIFARRSLTAEGAGKCSLVVGVDEPTIFESSIIRARPDLQKASSIFLYYLWSSPIGMHLLDTIRRQVAVAGITGKDLEEIEVPMPDRAEQDAIAAVLGALDDKIEQNHRTARSLEELALATYKAWFVDFEPVKAKAAGQTSFPGMPAATFSVLPDRLIDSPIGSVPAGWAVRPLSKVANFLNGLALQKYPPIGDGSDLPVIKIAELRKGSAEGGALANAGVPSAYVVNDGDLLFSWSGTLEVELWFGGRGALNQHLFKVTSDTYPRWLCLHWVRQHLPEFRLIASSKATTMGHIKRSHLDSALVVVPDRASLQAGDDVIGSLYELYASLALETRKLAILRDYLLPRLFSGRVRVKASQVE